MDKKGRLLRVGVLGCGPISQFAHFDACNKARNAELYAVCDLAPDLVAKMAAVHEPKVTYTNLDAMLADPNVDAVIVATADQFHVPICLRALEAGKHVLVEKPLGVNIEECELLRDKTSQKKLVCQIGNNRRFDPGIAYAKRFLREEGGHLIAMNAWYYDSAYRYTMTDNLQPIARRSGLAKRPEGNPKADKRRYFILTHASHLVDTARFFCGEMAWVRARMSERQGSYCWFIEVQFTNGTLGHLNLAIPIHGDFEEGFHIHGERGSIQGRVHLPWFHKASHVECFSSKDRRYSRPLGEDAHTYKLQIEGFADTILHGLPQHGATLEDGIAAMRALVAIARSAETGEKVELAAVSGSV